MSEHGMYGLPEQFLTEDEAGVVTVTRTRRYTRNGAEHTQEEIEVTS